MNQTPTPAAAGVYLPEGRLWVKGFCKVEKNRQKDYNRNAMKDTNIDIYQVNDSFFHKIFDTPENARDFLEKVLPVKKNVG